MTDNDNESAAQDTKRPTGGGAPAPRRRRSAALAQQIGDGFSIGNASTLGDLLYERSGNLRKMAQIGAFIAIWGRSVDAMGREPASVLELAEWINGKPSRATLSRYQVLFREAFPEYRTPSVLWSMARDQIGSEQIEVIATQIGAVQL
jgi:hypothetical protein